VRKASIGGQTLSASASMSRAAWRSNALRGEGEVGSIVPAVPCRHHKNDVVLFWKKQTFDLRLMSWQGNCDACFLKDRERKRIFERQPEVAQW